MLIRENVSKLFFSLIREIFSSTELERDRDGGGRASIAFPRRGGIRGSPGDTMMPRDMIKTATTRGAA
jgi:hypothetical protein